MQQVVQPLQALLLAPEAFFPTQMPCMPRFLELAVQAAC
jgi:hypothetical protein